MLPPRRHPRRPRVPSKGTRAPRSRRQRRMRNLRPTDPARGGGCTIWCRRDLSPRRAAPHPPTNRLWWGGGPPQFRVRPRGGQLEISVPRDPTAPRQLGPRRRHASGAARRSCVDPGGPPAGPTRPQAPPPANTCGGDICPIDDGRSELLQATCWDPHVTTEATSPHRILPGCVPAPHHSLQTSRATASPTVRV